MKLLYKKIGEHKLVPDQALRAQIDRSIEFGQGSHYEIPTGFAFEMPLGYSLHVVLASEPAKRNLVLAGYVMDARSAELRLLIMSHGRGNYTIGPGQVIAHMQVLKTEEIEFELIPEEKK